MNQVTCNRLVLPMFSASVYLSHVNLNPCELSNTGRNTQKCFRGYPAAGTGFEAGSGCGFPLGNGTRITDIETRPISPLISSSTPLPVPKPAAGRHLVSARTPTHRPDGGLNSCTVRFGFGSATAFWIGRAMPWVQSAGPSTDDSGKDPAPSMMA